MNVAGGKQIQRRKRGEEGEDSRDFDPMNGDERRVNAGIKVERQCELMVMVVVVMMMMMMMTTHFFGSEAGGSWKVTVYGRD